jgi:hypothetical protein
MKKLSKNTFVFNAQRDIDSKEVRSVIAEYMKTLEPWNYK